jgi:hypothetical protein
MKSHVTVILRSPVLNIEDALTSILEKYRLNEDDIESIRAHHWDYWHYFNSEDAGDSELRKQYSHENSVVLNCSSYVKNLPSDYLTSGVILDSGTWVDLQDLGWRMMAEPAEEDSKSMQMWKHEFIKILSENKAEVCVQIVVHC